MRPPLSCLSVCMLSKTHVLLVKDDCFYTHDLYTISYMSYTLQIVLKIIAFRLKYFTHKFEVFDAIVVVVSWVLDIASL